ncbi:hypothetical protein B5E92_13995 [Erysipelatoclostridium sp. An15]|uniref:hypothetical protein n=1 Tax=Erysipelatoclostridium sp. An15 TaxID=1965566 RepID=UPI000B39C32F|nr:hypothetical protein [Erysipelatoclostridium sp. An15]OUQ03225.1 hypothetical protein B5E92_13995 [Erysipelatoclostridium sp. An15]
MELDEKKMCEAVEPILEYLSITLRSERFKYQIEGYGENFTIELNPLDNELDITLNSSSLVKFDSSKSSIDSTSYERRLHKLIEQSRIEYMRINMLLGNINKLQYKQKYILIYGALLKKSIGSICKKLNISNSSYYRLLHIAKFNLALLLPETYQLKKSEKKE